MTAALKYTIASGDLFYIQSSSWWGGVQHRYIQVYMQTYIKGIQSEGKRGWALFGTAARLMDERHID
jgi:hypothetical protein